MRLQLTAAAALAVLAALATLPAQAVSPKRAAARVDVYTDDWIIVVSPSTQASVEVAEGVEVEASYAVDVLSGATRTLTADAISSATHFEERRHEVHGSVSTEVAPQTTFAGAYSLSLEPDYATHAVSATFVREVLDRLATLSLSYRINVERFGLAHDPKVREELLGHAFDLSWSHVLGPGTLLTGLFSAHLAYCGDALGCHSSPYRFVGVYTGPEEGAPLVAVRERHPEQRVRLAGALRLSQSLAPGYALHAGYRYYGDTWQIQGHTLDAALTAAFLGERLVLRAEGRFTWQSAASFYRDRYVFASPAAGGGAPRYRTADREMAELYNVTVALRGEWSLLGGELLRRLNLNARVAHSWYRYPTYSELPRREAWLVGAGVSVDF